MSNSYIMGDERRRLKGVGWATAPPFFHYFIYFLKLYKFLNFFKLFVFFKIK